MTHLERKESSRKFLQEGRSDEDVERLTGVSLMEIIVLRAEAASGPSNADKRPITSDFDIYSDIAPLRS